MVYVVMAMTTIATVYSISSINILNLLFKKKIENIQIKVTLLSSSFFFHSRFLNIKRKYIVLWKESPAHLCSGHKTLPMTPQHRLGE